MRQGIFSDAGSHRSIKRSFCLKAEEDSHRHSYVKLLLSFGQVQ